MHAVERADAREFLATLVRMPCRREPRPRLDSTIKKAAAHATAFRKANPSSTLTTFSPTSATA
jgi:hypothetical protein